MRHRIVEPVPHLERNWLPDGMLADILDVTENIVEHPMSLYAEYRPVAGV